MGLLQAPSLCRHLKSLQICQEEIGVWIAELRMFHSPLHDQGKREITLERYFPSEGVNDVWLNRIVDTVVDVVSICGVDDERSSPFGVVEEPKGLRYKPNCFVIGHDR